MARRKLGFWRRLAVVLVKPLMTVMSRRDWRGMENIPPDGPVIIVANHISHADPFVLAHYVYDAGRWPQYLAKASLFALPVAGPLLWSIRQIPVSRGTVDATKALDAAMSAIRAGTCVLIYPEGTTTKEPDLWPMRGKTGAARLWLATGAPVVPVAMWGPERLFDPRTRRLRPMPRTHVTVVAGPPIDLSMWTGAVPTTVTLQAITDHIMQTLRTMVADIRGGPPPPLWSRPNQETRTSGGTSAPAESEGRHGHTRDS